MLDTLAIDTDPTTTEAPEPETSPERFAITDEASAEWALRKGAAIEAETALLKAQYRARLAELEADKAAWERRFLPELRAWAEQEKERRRRQTVTTLAGTLAFRAESARLVLADDEAALAYAVDHLDYRALKTTLDRAVYREEAEKAFAETGELLPGVERTEGGESFSIRFPKAGKEGAVEEE